MTDTLAMDRKPEECTIHSFPHAFIDRRGEPILITTLNKKRCQGLIEMYLGYRPRNSFQGLPPVSDPACETWAKDMIRNGINLVALSFEEGVIGHSVVFPIDNVSCEMLTVVSPRFQNIGIGSELVRITIQMSDEIGFETIKLVVEMNNSIARRVYKKCGFDYTSEEMSGEVDMEMDLKRYRETVNIGVAAIMNKNVIAVQADQPCRATLEIFLSSSMAALPVVDDAGKLEGIITKTDLMLPSNVGKRVGDVLTRTVQSVLDGATLGKVIQMLQSRRLRAIPVVDKNGKLVGVIGRKEILAYYAERL